MHGKDLEMNVSKPLPLTGAHNVRDLGGYPARDGKTTKYKVFLRGDSLHGLTKEDKEYLDEYGVRLVIDVRGKQEAFMHPDRIDKKRIEYLHVPLLDHIQSEAMRGKMPDDMGDMYIGLVEESKEGFYEIFTRLSKEEGAALYHCTAGKDRTGVITMLLLRVAGVPDEVILADYAASEAYMKKAFDRQRKMVEKSGVKIPEYVFESRPEFLKKLMDHIDAAYGGAEGYLKDIGFVEEEIEKLKEKLV